MSQWEWLVQSTDHTGWSSSALTSASTRGCRRNDSRRQTAGNSGWYRHVRQTNAASAGTIKDSPPSDYPSTHSTQFNSHCSCRGGVGFLIIHLQPGKPRAPSTVTLVKLVTALNLSYTLLPEKEFSPQLIDLTKQKANKY